MKKSINLCTLIAIVIMAIFCFCSCDFLAYRDTDGAAQVPDNSSPSETPPDEEPETPVEPVKPTEPEPGKEPDEEPEIPPTLDKEPDEEPDAPPTPETPVYTVTFMDGDEIIDKFKTEENSTLSPRPVPDLAGYFFVGWEKDGELFDFTLPVVCDLTLCVRREPIIYTVTFIADGERVAQCGFTVENKSIDEPEVPAKERYTGVWEDYVLNIGDLSVNAVYTPVDYAVTFVANGQIIDVQTYNAESAQITEPVIPEKEHYNGVWESYSLNFENVTVNAIYSPVNYTITFVADGQTVSVQTYNAESAQITEPVIPDKEHYNGAWESYSLNFENITVNAIYSPVNYTITFVADGQTVSVQTYSADNPVIAVPDVPAKAGYTAEWENFGLFTNVTVHAVYTLIKGTEGLIYELGDRCYTVTGYDGESSEIVIPHYYNGLPVTGIGEQAFFNLSDKVRSVTMPECLKTIGRYAFFNCGLQTVTIPEGVISIGQRAFARCLSLKSVIISDSVTDIAGFAFYDCTALEYVRIGAGVNSIGEYAFSAEAPRALEFADPENWCLSDGETQTPISPETLASPTDAAAFIKNNTGYAYIKLA